MVNSRRKRLEREIDRDARVTTSGFVHEVMAVTLGQLQRMSLADLCPDPVDLFDEVEAITRKFRNIHRRLNDARINRRGARDRHAAAPEQVPPVVRAFAYHGAYLGAFASVEAFAHSRLDPAHPEQWAGYVDLTQAGIDLHLSGRYWTVDADGVTHAFQVGAPAGGPPSGDAGPHLPQEPRAPQEPQDRPPGERHRMPQHLPARALRAERPPGQPPAQLPVQAPEQARAALRLAGCDEPAVSELMTDYVARHVELTDHIWHYLRRVGVPRWVARHTDLSGLVEDWSTAGSLAWVTDADGGVHVFALADHLAHQAGHPNQPHHPHHPHRPRAES